MKSLNNSLVNAGGAGEGVGSGLVVSSKSSIEAGNLQISELDELAALGVPLVRRVESSV